MRLSVSKQQLFNHFLYSRLHGMNWYAGAFCAADIGGYPLVFQKADGKFVDSNVLDFLTNLEGVDKLCGKKLTLYLNYSTVSNCVDRLIRFRNSYGVDLEMVYVTPYRVHQVSCSNCTIYSINEQQNWFIEVRKYLSVFVSFLFSNSSNSRICEHTNARLESLLTEWCATSPHFCCLLPSFAFLAVWLK